MKRRINKAGDSETEKSASKLKPISKRISELTEELIDNSNKIQDNKLSSLLELYKKSTKHPILQTLSPQPEVFRTNPDRKKKPIEQYLDTVNNLYKKKDLDMLINPTSVYSAYELWSPREIAIFEAAILRFGNHFDFIAEMVGSKSAKDCYEFYWEWKNTSHFRAYKTNQNSITRSGYEPFV